MCFCNFVQNFVLPPWNGHRLLFKCSILQRQGLIFLMGLFVRLKWIPRSCTLSLLHLHASTLMQWVKVSCFLLLPKNKEMVLRKVLDLNGLMESFLDDVLKATITLHKLGTGQAGKPRDEVCALEKTEILYSRTLSILSWRQRVLERMWRWDKTPR